MPTRDEHLAQARHNADFYSTVDKAGYKDWAATVLFYTALHYVDALLATKGMHPPKHKTRDVAVSSVFELRPIFSHYSALKNASYNARYNVPSGFSSAYISQLESVHLAAVKNEVALHVPVS